MSSPAAPSASVRNPFPGPQPYRAADRDHFYGREGVARKLASTIQAHRCVALYGPSGAGKSSVMQAAVIPNFEDEYDFRHVTVDGWPPEEPPLRWLLYSMYTQLKLVAPAEELDLHKSVEWTLQRAYRRSDRPILIYLDQIEQLLYTHRRHDEVEDFLDWLDRFVERPRRGLHVVLAMREDYLGHFRDRARGRYRLLENGFRLGPMTVGEIVGAVCQASADGEPPQTWSPKEMRPLMLQVRTPGQLESDRAEIQTAFAQIVCRALFAQRAESGDTNSTQAVQAEPILESYLETTLASLGSLRVVAESLLENYLVAADGSRSLLTEEAARASGLLNNQELSDVLTKLESAAILRAEQHRGSRYYEIGHDWLASKVFERKQERAARAAAQQRDRELELEREAELRSAEEQLRQSQVQTKQARRLLTILSVFSLLAVALGTLAWVQREAARLSEDRALAAKNEALRAEGRARAAKNQAQLASLVAAVRELTARGQYNLAAALLMEIEKPEQVRGWTELALEILAHPAPMYILRHKQEVTSAAWSPDNRSLLAGVGNLAYIWRDGKESVALKGHTGVVTSVAWSPDGDRILTTSRDKTARVWNSDGSPNALLKGHTGAILQGSWRFDGERIVTASSDNTARIWEPDGSQEAIVLQGFEYPVNHAQWSPDGQHLVALSEKNKVLVWKAKASDKPLIVQEKLGYERAVWSPDSRHLALVEKYSGELLVLKASGKWKPNFRTNVSSISDIAWSPDSKQLLVGSDDRIARVLDVDGSNDPILLRGHTGFLRHVTWSPDGKHIGTASGDNTARIWGADGSEETVFHGNADDVRQISWSPDGTQIVTASSDKTIRVWSPTQNVEPVIHRGHTASIFQTAWSPDGQFAVTGSMDHTARIWSVDGSVAPRVLENPGPVMHTAWNPTGKLLSTTTLSGTLLWNVDEPGKPTVLFDGFSVYSTWSPDGQKIAISTVQDKRRVIIMTTDRSEPPTILGEHTEMVYRTAWHPSGSHLASASFDHTARVWDVDGAGESILLEGHTGRVFDIAWSPDGNRIVTASWDDTARVWDPNNLEATVVLKGHTDQIRNAAWSPDGRRIVTASDDNSARIWNADGTGDPLLLHGHTDDVPLALWSPDGNSIVTVSRDTTARVWNLNNLDDPIVLRGHTGPLDYAAWSPDGLRIITVSEDATARVWRLDIPYLQESLRRSIRECLSAEQRQTYLSETEAAALVGYQQCKKRSPRGGV